MMEAYTLEREYGVYVSAPVDDWAGWHTLEEMRALDPTSDAIPDIIVMMQAAISACYASDDDFWRVTVIPDPMSGGQSSWVLANKDHGRNGTTIFASSLPLDWLRECSDFHLVKVTAFVDLVRGTCRYEATPYGSVNQ